MTPTTFDDATVAALRELCERFAKVSMATQENEAALRNDFLNPFWALLGWDLQNLGGVAPSLREVAIEPPVHSSGRQKRADYVFRINGIQKFVCEAKAAHVSLKPDDAFQAQRYAYNLGIHIAVLTNFQTTRVYAVGGKPDRKNPFPPVLSWTVADIKADPSVADMFRRERVADGSLEKFLQELPKRPVGERGGWMPRIAKNRTADKEFLEWLEAQRLETSKALVRDNPHIQWNENLNLIATRVLDRILFLRICEDRGISVGRSLRTFLEQCPPGTGTALYEEFKAHYKRLRRTFNGVLFAEHQADDVQLGEKSLRPLVEELISEDSPYLFNVLPVEVIGSVYERFLGRQVIVKGKRVELEEKPETRRSGGVYYTPEIAAKAIVEDTIGQAIGNPTAKGAAAKFGKLRVLDLACGSGAFLIQAFNRLCDAYIAYFQTFKGTLGDQGRIGSDGIVRLSTPLKRRIATECLFGVDLDPQAVEVTMMSLYLKILEGETTETLSVSTQTNLFEPHLPDLKKNIRCGNSVLESDFEDCELSDEVQAELRARHPIDWKVAFPEPVRTGGFDVIIGNPPYVRPHRILPAEKEYFWKRMSTFEKKSDLYVCFVERALSLLREGGQFGFIMSRTWLTNDSFQAMRRQLLELLDTRLLLECPDELFADAAVRTVILTGTRRDSTSNRARPPIQVGDLTDMGVQVRGSFSHAEIGADARALFDLSAVDPRLTAVRRRMNSRALPLKASFDVMFGLKTGDDQRFLHQDHRHDVDKPLVTGEDVQRWSIARHRLYVHYDPAEMRRHRQTARPGEPARFEAPKLMVKDTSSSLAGALDEEGRYAKDVLLVLKRDDNPGLGLDYLLGVINSRLMTFYFRSTFNTVHVQKGELEVFPVTVEPGTPQVKRIAALARRLSGAGTGTSRERAQNELEDAVMELYGLTDEDRVVVENWFSTAVK